MYVLRNCSSFRLYLLLLFFKPAQESQDHGKHSTNSPPPTTCHIASQKRPSCVNFTQPCPGCSLAMSTSTQGFSEPLEDLGCKLLLNINIFQWLLRRKCLAVLQIYCLYFHFHSQVTFQPRVFNSHQEQRLYHS